jgi:RimJ/RimL family protein N-acetyltransferase
MSNTEKEHFTQQSIAEEILPNGFLLKDYTHDDKKSLLSLYDNLRNTNIGRETLRYYFTGMVTKSTFAAAIENPSIRYRIVVLSPDRKAVGWGAYRIDAKDPRRAELARLIIPQYQRMGLGTALIERLIRKCSLLNPEVTRMESQTLPDNRAAIGSLTKAAKTLGGFRDEKTSSSHVHFSFPLK